MEKLFTDAETFTKERPTKVTAQQEQDFYKKIAEEIIENDWSNDALEDVIEDVSEISIFDNGYEIAKDLESFNKKASYNIGTQFIEFLDDFGYRKNQILDENVKAWVNACNPKPKFAKGTKLIVEIDLNREKTKGFVVFVTGFSEKQACYLIDENSERQGETVITYEKVESNCAVSN